MIMPLMNPFSKLLKEKESTKKSIEITRRQKAVYLNISKYTTIGLGNILI